MRRSTKSDSFLVVVALVLFIAGCGGGKTQMVGMHPSAAPPSPPAAVYTVQQCADLTSGQVIQVPPMTYYLDHAVPAPRLYEFDANRRGAVMVNHWMEGDADVYFGYVGSTNRGFKFVIPQDRTRMASRQVYAPSQFRTFYEGPVMKPDGRPVLDCPMVPEPGNRPAPMPVVPGAPQPPPSSGIGCTMDRECPNEEICVDDRCVHPAAGEVPDPPAVACGADRDCPEEEICEDDRCVPIEEEAAAAPAAKPAAAHPKPAAEPLRRSDAECRGGRVCRDGICQRPPPPKKVGSSCRVDVDCPDDLVCEKMKCVRDPDATGKKKGSR